MRVQHYDDATPSSAYGLACRNISFEPTRGGTPLSGVWCELAPGKTSTPHRHHDSEAFVISRGSGYVESGGRRVQVQTGDVVLLEPFADHRVVCTGPDPLVFLDFWWEDKVTLREMAAETRPKVPNFLVTATPPTPNGDLHVGHLSGPYLGADAFCRSMRAAGSSTLLISGSDDHQSYVPRQAKALGESARVVASDFAERMHSTLVKCGFEFDIFSRPSSSKYHRDYVSEFFATLHKNGKFVDRIVDALYCDDCGIYLFEAHVRGVCPHCHSASDGCACEGCARPNDCTDLIDPVCRYCSKSATRRATRRLYFPLNDYAERLKNFHFRTSMSPHMRAMCADMLADGLPDIAVSYSTDWGIDFPAPGFESQKIYVWAEMLPGFFAEIQEALDQRGGEPRTWRDVWKTHELVQFFGFDNGYFHAVLFPALLMAYDATLPLPVAFITNEFLKLDGEKFSTSRGHAIWGSDILSKLPSTYLRFYLAYIRPESEQTDFRLGSCADFLETHVLVELRNWIADYESRRTAELGAGVPEPGSWTEDHRAFFTELEHSLIAATRSNSLSDFSLRTGAGLVNRLVRVAQEFGVRHMPEVGRPALGSERRTSLALEVLALRVIARMLLPISPALAEGLWPTPSALVGDPLEFPRNGTALKPIRLPQIDELQRWIETIRAPKPEPQVETSHVEVVQAGDLAGPEALSIRIKGWVASSVGRDEVLDDMTLRSLGVDSITVLSMIARVMKEERIDASLAAAALSDMSILGKMQTINDLVKAAEQLASVGRVQ